LEIDDIRGMTDEELNDELDATQQALMNLRFRVATMQLSNVNEIKSAKTRIARINTIIRERELARVVS
jgi:large subunit ribosomal protein L29